MNINKKIHNQNMHMFLDFWILKYIIKPSAIVYALAKTKGFVSLFHYFRFIFYSLNQIKLLVKNLPRLI